jgi:hypothetical protein
MKEFRSELSVITNLSALEMRTSTLAKMVVEAVECLGIDIRQTTASPFNEATDMGGATDISNSAGRGIPCAS